MEYECCHQSLWYRWVLGRGSHPSPGFAGGPQVLMLGEVTATLIYYAQEAFRQGCCSHINTLCTKLCCHQSLWYRWALGRGSHPSPGFAGGPQVLMLGEVTATRYLARRAEDWLVQIVIKFNKHGMHSPKQALLESPRTYLLWRRSSRSVPSVVYVLARRSRSHVS